MYYIVQTSHEGEIFPGQEYLYGYSTADIQEMPYMLALSSVCGMKVRMLGDSGVNVLINFTDPLKGDDLENQYQVFVRDLVDILRDALPLMSSLYRTFYELFLAEYDKNGITLSRLPDMGDIDDSIRKTEHP